MGFFADQRIKNGTRASTSEDRAPMPKNSLNMDIKPNVMGGDKGNELNLNDKPAFVMDKNQKKHSRLDIVG